MRFLGNIEAKTDAKGRAFLPSAFRKVLQVAGEERLVVRKDVYAPCLVIYPESVWNGVVDTLRAKLSRWDRVERQTFRAFVADVEEVTLDSNGRLLISQRLRALAGIGTDVRFIGMDDTIELWSVENSESFMNPEEFAESLERLMKEEP